MRDIVLMTNQGLSVEREGVSRTGRGVENVLKLYKGSNDLYSGSDLDS